MNLEDHDPTVRSVSKQFIEPAKWYPAGTILHAVWRRTCGFTVSAGNNPLGINELTRLSRAQLMMRRLLRSCFPSRQIGIVFTRKAANG
jgi:hypothetical protein